MSGDHPFRIRGRLRHDVEQIFKLTEPADLGLQLTDGQHASSGMRMMPLEIQDEAKRRGLIPDPPAVGAEDGANE
jgi:hypothetical protein